MRCLRGASQAMSLAVDTAMPAKTTVDGRTRSQVLSGALRRVSSGRQQCVASWTKPRSHMYRRSIQTHPVSIAGRKGTVGKAELTGRNPSGPTGKNLCQAIVFVSSGLGCSSSVPTRQCASYAHPSVLMPE